MLRILLAFIVLHITLPLAPLRAFAQSPRDVILSCFQQGAFNPYLMQICSGMLVTPVDFHGCMNGGPCMGQPPSNPLPIPSGAPFCGSMGLGFCPAPQPCGRPFPPYTVSCVPPAPIVAFACGAPGYPPCLHAQPCGMPGTLFCLPLPPVDSGGAFGAFNPTLQVALPDGFDRSVEADRLGIKFVAPAIPDLHELERCRNEAWSEDKFFECVASDALPPEYRLTKACLEEHENDAGAAAICVTGNEDAMNAYGKFRGVQDCMSDANANEYQVAGCLGDQFLDEEQRYYLRCVTDNNADLTTSAVCAVSRDLNPEQQIALSCAVQTGGNPKLFAACTAGKLTARELNKCWEEGIATNQGCFGPNNELRKAANKIREEICNATGQNSVACDAYSYWHNNVLAPGPNHEIVKHFNNGLKDLRDGPGKNNELVKIGRKADEIFNSIGDAFKF